MYKITKDTRIESNIDYIIDRYHRPLPEFIDKLNKKGNNFFYEYVDEGCKNLKELKLKFYDFTASMFDHIEEEEEHLFPLVIELYNSSLPNNSKISVSVDNGYIAKITEEHKNFEKIAFEIEENLKKIYSNEKTKSLEELLKLFSFFKEETYEHIQAEVELLEKLMDKINSRK